MIKKLLIVLMTCFLLLGCTESEKNPTVSTVTDKAEIKFKEEVQQAVKLQRDLLNSKSFEVIGKNLKTGKQTLFNSLTGEEIVPCKGSPFTLSTDKKDYPGIKQDKANTNTNQDNTTTTPNDNPDCTVTILNPSAELSKLIKATGSVVKGTVMKNGKEVPTIFTFSASAIYPGSDCITEYKDGKQYQELCVSNENSCPSIYKWSKLFGELYPAFVCPQCTTQEEVDLEVIKQMNQLHPECVEVLKL